MRIFRVEANGATTPVSGLSAIKHNELFQMVDDEGKVKKDPNGFSVFRLIHNPQGNHDYRYEPIR